MSKKAQKNQPEKKQAQIVEEQKDPMLRALQKKVRNINKKLTEITQLSTRKDLKPEQEQKISKKPQVTQQKEKYLEMIEIYKEIAGQSQKIIRKTQLTELEDLAAVIAAKQYSVDLGFLFNQNVDNIVRVLTTPTSADLTLKQRIDEIYDSLTFSANNLKLKKSLKQFVQANSDRKRQGQNSNTIQSETVSVQCQKQKQTETKQIQKQQKLQLTQPVAPQVCPQPKVQQPVRVVQVTATQPLLSNQAPKIQSAPVQVSTPAPQASTVQTENKQTQQKTEGEQKEEGKGQKRGYNRGYRGRGSRGGERNGQKQYDDQRPQKKRSFKPKFENGQQDKRREERRRESSSSSSSSDSEPKAREFKREQVKELIQDGFIVVGKPKPKARDQKQYHDKQHGKKNFHNNHTKKNY